jgi:hypothetical protein
VDEECGAVEVALGRDGVVFLEEQAHNADVDAELELVGDGPVAGIQRQPAQSSSFSSRSASSMRRAVICSSKVTARGWSTATAFCRTCFWMSASVNVARAATVSLRTWRETMRPVDSATTAWRKACRSAVSEGDCFRVWCSKPVSGQPQAV